jgi:hypothetical protein
MGHRPRSLVVGVVVLVAVLWSAGTASSSQPVHRAVVRGSVQADGRPDGAPVGWRVAHPAPGRYQVTVAAPKATLEVPIWDSVADVTVRPMGGGTNEISFSRDGFPVDADFSFVVLTRP